MLQAALHDWFIKRLGLRWACGGAAASFHRWVGMRTLFSFLCAIFLVLDKVCEATL